MILQRKGILAIRGPRNASKITPNNRLLARELLGKWGIKRLPLSGDERENMDFMGVGMKHIRKENTRGGPHGRRVALVFSKDVSHWPLVMMTEGEVGVWSPRVF